MESVLRSWRPSSTFVCASCRLRQAQALRRDTRTGRSGQASRALSILGSPPRAGRNDDTSLSSQQLFLQQRRRSPLRLQRRYQSRWGSEKSTGGFASGGFGGDGLGGGGFGTPGFGRTQPEAKAKESRGFALTEEETRRREDLLGPVRKVSAAQTPSATNTPRTMTASAPPAYRQPARPSSSTSASKPWWADTPRPEPPRQNSFKQSETPRKDRYSRRDIQDLTNAQIGGKGRFSGPSLGASNGFSKEKPSTAHGSSYKEDRRYDGRRNEDRGEFGSNNTGYNSTRSRFDERPPSDRQAQFLETIGDRPRESRVRRTFPALQPTQHPNQQDWSSFDKAMEQNFGTRRSREAATTRNTTQTATRGQYFHDPAKLYPQQEAAVEVPVYQPSRSVDDSYDRRRRNPEMYRDQDARDTRDAREREKGSRRDAGRGDRSRGRSAMQSSSYGGGYDEDYDEYEEEDRAEARRQRKAARKAAQEAIEEQEAEKQAYVPKPIMLPMFITVANLAEALGVKQARFLDDLTEFGIDNISGTSVMEGETAALVAAEYGFDPTVDIGDAVDLKPRPLAEDLASVPARPPIVTIMGHVDHGKTTMLDWLRKSSIAAQEHGGITQHIGAFSVKMSTGKAITFLDTPGHAAFLTMRQRGANVTDIVILVVAADDGVKPQTIEALKHAQAAKVPIIVAINKMDKDEANIELVKNMLTSQGVELEEYGGDVQAVPVSGRTGLGMDNLEESIVTLSEILDHRAEPDGMAEGWILEASIKPIGKAATVLVKRGTLRVGDIIAAGTTWAKIRVLRNEAGVEIDEAPPGTPVEVLGWRDPPQSGDQVIQAPDETRARAAITYRIDMRDREKAAAETAAQERRSREAAEAAEAAAEAAAEGGEDGEALVKPKTSTGGETFSKREEVIEPGGTRFLTFTVKGDVVGSVEAVCAAVAEIGNNEVQPRILRSSAGQVRESDVSHAATSKSTIINFNNPIDPGIERKAIDAGVKILDHTIIYHMVDEVKSLLSEHLAPLVSHKVLGEAEVLQIFPINVKKRIFKNIAGCRVRTGQVSATALYKVLRAGEKVFDGKLADLKHKQKDVTEMRKGTECGISFEEFDDLQVGDVIQSYEVHSEKRHL